MLSFLLPFSLISMCIAYTEDQMHIVKQYLTLRDKSEWDMMNEDEFRQNNNKLRRLFIRLKEVGVV